MAEDKFHYDLDFQTNKIKDARIPTQTGAAHDEDAINRKYVDDKGKYDTTLATTLPTVEKTGGLPANTPSATVAGKTFKELFDLILYPLKAATYTTPTVVASVDNLSSIIPDATFQTNVVLKATPTLNDSPSVVSYTFSGAGITGTITQATPTYTVPNYILANGDNTWTVGVNYAASGVKNDTHENASPTGQFVAGHVSSQVKITTKPAVMYGVDYTLRDATTQSGAGLSTYIDCVMSNPSAPFKIELGNTAPVSVNIALPQNNADIRVTMNDNDISAAFNRVVLSNVKAWDVGTDMDYSVFHWNSALKLNSPTTILVEPFYRFYTRIYDVIWDSQDNQLKIDHASNVQSWDLGGDVPIPANKFSIKRQPNGDIRIVSNGATGVIKQIERGRPYKVDSNLSTTDYTMVDQVGRAQHINGSDTYTFRIWVQEGVTSLFYSGLFPNQLFA